MKYSFLTIQTQYENLGDALIIRELVALLSQHSKLIVDTSHCPDWFAEMLNLPKGTQHLRGRIAMMQAMMLLRLQGHDVFFALIPGGNFGELSWLKFVKGLLMLLPLGVMKALGIKLIQLGVSFERMGWRAMLLLRLRGYFMHAFYVRDEQSSALLKQYKIRHKGILPDLAFHLFTREVKPVGQLKRVCLSFRTDQYSTQKDRVRDVVDALVEAMPKATNYVLSVQVERDLKGMKYIQQHLNAKHGIEAEIFHEARDIDKIQAFYATVDAVVSNRLHVLLLGGSACGRLVACVDETNQKVAGLFGTVGRRDLVVAMDKVTPQLMKQALAQDAFTATAEQKALVKGVETIFA